MSEFKSASAVHLHPRVGASWGFQKCKEKSRKIPKHVGIEMQDNNKNLNKKTKDLHKITRILSKF